MVRRFMTRVIDAVSAQCLRQLFSDSDKPPRIIASFPSDARPCDVYPGEPSLMWLVQLSEPERLRLDSDSPRLS